MKFPAAPALLALFACGPECPVPEPQRSWVAAGESTELQFDHEIDAQPVGARFSGAALASTPLAPMMRPPVIIKADDFRGLDRGFKEILERATRRHIPLALGVIAQSLDLMNGDSRACLSRADPAAIELFDHGFDHFIGHDGRAEFSGPSAAEQADHLHWAQTAIKDAFGIEAHSFSPPANAADASTAVVLAALPELEVTIFEPQIPGIAFLPYTIDLEAPVFRVVELEAFKKSYAEHRDDGVPMLLQGHPRAWRFHDWTRFDQILDFLIADGRRFSTPTEEARWQLDLPLVTVEKIGRQRYRFEAPEAHWAHALELSEPSESLSPARR